MLPRAITNENVPILSPQRRSQHSFNAAPFSSPAMSSSKKRQRVAETLREAQQMEIRGDARGAAKLYEEAYRIVPDSSIAVKLVAAQKVAAATSRRQQQGADGKKIKNPTMPSRVVASDADILSATIAAYSTKKPRLRPALEDISSSTNQLTPSRESTPIKALFDNNSIAESSHSAEQQYIDCESMEMEAPSYEEPSAAVAPPRSRESVARTLRDKVAAVIQYQLLDVLNNGSLEELLELRLIGERRAQYIMELRDEGTRFSSLNDLEAIGMCEKQISTFKYENLAMAVGTF